MPRHPERLCLGTGVSLQLLELGSAVAILASLRPVPPELPPLSGSPHVPLIRHPGRSQAAVRTPLCAFYLRLQVWKSHLHLLVFTPLK